VGGAPASGLALGAIGPARKNGGPGVEKRLDFGPQKPVRDAASGPRQDRRVKRATSSAFARLLGPERADRRNSVASGEGEAGQHSPAVEGAVSGDRGHCSGRGYAFAVRFRGSITHTSRTSAKK